MSFLTSLRSEILKTKRTAAFYFTLVGAAIVPGIYLLNVILDEISDSKKDPLNSIFKLANEMNAIAFFPWFVILICTLLPQIEYKNNTWKQVFASPQTKGAVFMAKYVSIHLLLLLYMVAHLFFMFIVSVICHFVMPELDLLNQPFDVHRLIVNVTNLYLTVLAIGTIQFWLGLRFRNFIVPVAVGFALWFAGMMLVFEYQSVNAKYFPYSFQIHSLLPKLKPRLNQVEWTSLAYSVIFMILGFIDFSRRKMKA